MFKLLKKFKNIIKGFESLKKDLKDINEVLEKLKY